MGSIKPEATTTVDKAKILPLFDNLCLSNQDGARAGTPYQLQTAANFGAALDHALTLTVTNLMIYIDPSHLRFATNPLDVRNFAEMQLDQDFPNQLPDGSLILHPLVELLN